MRGKYSGNKKRGLSKASFSYSLQKPFQAFLFVLTTTSGKLTGP